MNQIILFFSLFFSFLVPARELHPYHVGSLEIKYNSSSRNFEITAQFFVDDFEKAIQKKYQKQFVFDENKNKLDAQVQAYFLENFKLKSNNKFLKLNYLGYEIHQESIKIYLESEATENPKKIESALSVLYDYYDDQMNIVHIIVNGNRKSTKLIAPNRYFYQNFTK